jgi:hypothetical protein
MDAMVTAHALATGRKKILILRIPITMQGIAVEGKIPACGR